MASRRERRDPMGIGLAVLNRVAQSPLIDKLGLREVTEKAIYQGTKAGFRAASKAGRTFRKVQARGSGTRQEKVGDSGVFDLHPSEDQAMIVDVVKDFAAEVLRPGAAEAESADATPKEVLAQTNDFGLTLLNIPEELGGLSVARSVITGVLVNEALAEGDMGQAVACLAPAAVASAIALWGTAVQQRTYLPEFTDREAPAAALAIAEPHLLFDPFRLETTAQRHGSGFLLDGLKSAVVRGTEAELFVVAADLEGEGPRLFIVEPRADGISVADDPGMGLRAAALTRLKLDHVAVGADALLGDGEDYRECIRLSRLAWAALAVGTGKAVLDYVARYVTTRQAFGEPIAHRQAVAFKVADIAIELEGLRLVTYKAASRAEAGIDNAREVAAARRLAADYGMQIGTDGVQLLGGHGYVKEHPVERWYRDLRAVGLMEGALLV